MSDLDIRLLESKNESQEREKSVQVCEICLLMYQKISTNYYENME